MRKVTSVTSTGVVTVERRFEEGSLTLGLGGSYKADIGGGVHPLFQPDPSERSWRKLPGLIDRAGFAFLWFGFWWLSGNLGGPGSLTIASEREAQTALSLRTLLGGSGLLVWDFMGVSKRTSTHCVDRGSLRLTFGLGWV